MIRDTTGTDRVVKQKTRLPIIYGVMVVIIVLLILGVLTPAKSIVNSWFSAELTVSMDRIHIATASRGHFERAISVQGKIVASIRPSLFSLSDGAVTLKVKSGDLVEKGDVVATIDNPELLNQLQQELSIKEQIQNDLERLKISTQQANLARKHEIVLINIILKSAERRMARMEETYANRLVSKEEYETTQDELATAQANLKHSIERIDLENSRLDFELVSKQLDVNRQKLKIENLRRQVEDLKVLTPTDGVVGNIVVEEKDKVSRNQLLMTVVNLSAYEIDVEIPENYADDLTLGVSSIVSYQDRTFNGTLTSISPEVTDGYILGRVSIENSAALESRQNQRVTVKLVLESIADAVTIQRGPFLNEGAGRTIYVVENQLATRRNIRIGGIGVSEVEILEGIEPGEQVIVSSTSAFANAEKVLLR